MNIRFHLSSKVKFLIISFIIAFVVLMLLFIWKPDVMRSKKRWIRAVFVFSIAFVPGVMAAMICAKTITVVWDKVFARNSTEIVSDIEENDEEEKKKI